MISHLQTSLISLAFTAALSTAAFAGEPASRADFDHSSVALLRGEKSDGTWQAGLQIKLPGDWKTYWKVPGDAGIPPEFDWSGSTNLRDVKVAWPAPRRYRDQAGESIGYKHEVVFPLTVTPEKAGQPVRLHLKLFYAACDDICVPGQAELALDLAETSSGSSDAGKIEEFTARVPRPAHETLQLQDARFEEIDGKPALDVAITGPAVGEDVDVFVSGLDVAYFRQPQATGMQADTSSYRLFIDGIKGLDAIRGKRLDIVVVTGQVAVTRSVDVR
jgi:DsbC/DsbD-like thiol-disulfide interchange protein